MRRPQFLTREVNILVLSGLFGSAIGWFAKNAIEHAISDKNFWLALAPVVLPILFLMAMRPVLGAAAVLAFGFVNPSLLPPLIEVGELSFRYVDGMFGLLMCVVLAWSVIVRRAAVLADGRELFVPLACFFLYIGLSLIVVRISAPHFVGASIASYIRLVLTAAFAPVLCAALRDKWDVQFFNKSLLFFFTATVAVGSTLVLLGLERGDAETVGRRTGGVIGIGSLGLVSGLLIMYALIKRDENRCSMTWIVSLVVGLVGLYLAKTATTVFAVAATATVYFATMRSREAGLLRVISVGAVAMIAAVLAIVSLRPADVSGLTHVSSGSFAERLMIGYAGLWIFFDNPLVGVGWQASTSPTVVSSPALVSAVTRTFSHIYSDYFFETPPPTLHNMYIQFLAELGLIGFGLFVWVCFKTKKRVAQIVSNVSAESPYRVWAQFYALGLIFLLVSWNSNPLFGGQIETMLAFTFLAVLANVDRLERERRQQITSDGTVKIGSVNYRQRRDR